MKRPKITQLHGAMQPIVRKRKVKVEEAKVDTKWGKLFGSLRPKKKSK